MNTPSSVAQILLVEDNEADQTLTLEGLRQTAINTQVHIVENGVAATDFLHKEGKFANAPRPHLIILDLNLPRMDGREVLMLTKDDEMLSDIPIVVFSTSDSREEIRNAFKLGANSYIVKPSDLDEFLAVVEKIADYWLGVSHIPNHPE